MGSTFARVKTWVAGETLTASDLNAEFDNVLDNLDPSGIDDESSTATAMRATTDPYPASVASLATSLQGELQRLRYVIAQITGETYWYIDPDISLASINTSYMRGDNGTTKAWFYNNTAPTGWTIDAVLADVVLAVKGGSNAYNVNGGNPGGTWTQPNHTHTGPSHAHATSDHTLTTDEIPSHTHDVTIYTGAGGSAVYVSGYNDNTPSKTASAAATATGGGTAHNHGNTGAGGTDNTGGGATANTWRPSAVVGIVCTLG